MKKGDRVRVRIGGTVFAGKTGVITATYESGTIMVQLDGNLYPTLPFAPSELEGETWEPTEAELTKKEALSLKRRYRSRSGGLGRPS